MDTSLLNNLADQLEKIARNSKIQLESKLNNENLSNDDKEKFKEINKLQENLIVALQNKDINKLNELLTDANNINK